MAYRDTILATSGLYAYYEFSETSGTTADNSQGTAAYDGTFVDGVTLNQTGQTGITPCVSFDGSNDYITVPDNNVFSINLTNAFTVEVWVNITTGANRHIIGKANEWRLEWDNDNTRFLWRTVKSTDAELYTVYGNSGKSTGTWYHVVATVAGAPGSTLPKLYVNGSQEVSGGSSGSGGLYTAGSGAVIMGKHVTASTFLNAKLDDVAIYGVALSGTDISNHYAAVSSTDVSVSAVVSDVSVGGDTTTSVTTDANVTAALSDTIITGKQPTVSTDGGVLVGADVSNTAVTGSTSTVSATRFIELIPLVSNTTVAATGPAIQTEENVITFVPIDDTSMTAADADTLTGFDLGALLFNQEKVFAFKIGNTGTRAYDVTLSATSVNSSIVSLVEFSSDKSTYSSTITIESVQSNTVSDPVWVKFSPASASPGEGTFLINVEQSNA